MKIPATRSEALASGSKTYFTGKPCVLGEIAERHTKSKNCLCGAHKKMEADRKSAYYIEKRDHLISYSSEYQATNKEKARSYRKKYIDKDPESAKAQARAWYEQNREAVVMRSRAWFVQNKDRAIANSRAWAERNKSEITQYRRNRKKRVLERTPAWFSDLDRFVLEEAYLLAAHRKLVTGIDWHVDHMFPLYSRTVSGLHSWTNIQVIPAFMNLMKQNKLVFTEHFEWMSYLQSHP